MSGTDAGKTPRALAKLLIEARFDGDGRLHAVTGPLAGSFHVGSDTWLSVLQIACGHPGVSASIAPVAIEGLAARLVAMAAVVEVLPDDHGGLLVFASLAAGATRTLKLVIAPPAPHTARVPTPLEMDASLLQEVIDAIPGTISVKAPDRRYLLVNRAWEHYAGLTRDKIVGRRHEALAPRRVSAENQAQHTSDVRSRDEQVLTSGLPWLNAEERYFTPQGEERVLLSNKVPALFAGGQPRAVVSVTMDITDRVRAEEALIAARTAAEAADRQKSELLNVLGHELRTPMNAILGSAAILRGLAPLPAQSAALEDLEAASRRLVQVLNEIVLYGDVAYGAIQMEPVPIDPAWVIDAQIETRRSGLSANVALLTEGVATCGMIDIDPHWFGQILDRLLDNAIKFTPSGQITVRLQRLGDIQGRPAIGLEVEDTGIGVAPEHQAALFRPFVQADRGTTRAFEGLGLGLAVAHGAVSRCGGWIGYAPGSDGGSRFLVVLPTGPAVVPPTGDWVTVLGPASLALGAIVTSLQLAGSRVATGGIAEDVAPLARLSGRSVIVHGATPEEVADLRRRLAPQHRVIAVGADRSLPGVLALGADTSADAIVAAALNRSAG